MAKKIEYVTKTARQHHAERTHTRPTQLWFKANIHGGASNDFAAPKGEVGAIPRKAKG